MLRIVQNIRGASLAMAFTSLIAGAASAQSLEQAALDQTDQATTAAPPAAPPRSIIQRYTPPAPHARGAMTLLVDEPQAAGSPASQTTAGRAPIGDRVDGPAINALAAGRSAITVSVAGDHRQ